MRACVCASVTRCILVALVYVRRRSRLACARKRRRRVAGTQRTDDSNVIVNVINVSERGAVQVAAGCVEQVSVHCVVCVTCVCHRSRAAFMSGGSIVARMRGGDTQSNTPSTPTTPAFDMQIVTTAARSSLASSVTLGARVRACSLCCVRDCVCFHCRQVAHVS
jgi:hypothetical protein